MRSRSSSVDERCSPSEDSIWERRAEAESVVKAARAKWWMATDDIRTSGQAECRVGIYSLFVRLTEILLRGTKVVNPE